MAHIKLESPRGSPGMKNELFKLIDGGRSPGSGEKKRLFSSFWKKPKLGKRAMRNEFEHMALDGPSYSAESENATGSETYSGGDTGDGWNIESRDDDDMWGFDTGTNNTREEPRNTDNGFPPLPPSNSGLSKSGSVQSDSSHTRQPNPKLTVKRTPKKKETSGKPKDFSLTQMISQSFDSEAAEDAHTINSQSFSFSEPPTEFTQLDLSGEATKFIRLDDGYQVQKSPKRIEVDELKIEDFDEEEEELTETFDSSGTTEQVDSEIPSFKDRLAFYKTRSNQNTRPISPQNTSETVMKTENSNKFDVDEARKRESLTSQARSYNNKNLEGEQVKLNDQIAPPTNDKDSSVQDRIKRFQPGLSGKLSHPGPGKGEQRYSFPAATAPKHNIQATSRIIPKASHPTSSATSTQHRRAWSEERKLTTSSKQTNEATDTPMGVVAPFKAVHRHTLGGRSRSTMKEREPATSATTKEDPSMLTVAQRKAVFLSSRSFDSSDKLHGDSIGSQHNDKRLSGSKSLRLSDTSHGSIAIEGKTIGGKRIAIIRQGRNRSIGDETTAIKKATFTKRQSDAKEGRVKSLRSSIEGTSQIAPSSSIQPAARISPTNLYRQSIANLKSKTKEVTLSEFQKLKLQAELKCTQPESSSFQFTVPAQKKQPIGGTKPEVEESKLETGHRNSEIVTDNPTSHVTAPKTTSAGGPRVSIADRKKAFMCNLQDQMESTTTTLSCNASDSTLSSLIPAARQSKVLAKTDPVQDNDDLKSEKKTQLVEDHQKPTSGTLSIADRMKAFANDAGASEAPEENKRSSLATSDSSNVVLPYKHSAGRPSRMTSDAEVPSVKRPLPIVVGKKSLGLSFRKPATSTWANENSTSRRSLSAINENISPRRSSTPSNFPRSRGNALHEINVSNKPSAAQAKKDEEVKCSKPALLDTPIEPETASEPKCSSPRLGERFKSIADRQRVFGPAPRTSSVADDSAISRQTRALTPSKQIKTRLSASGVAQTSSDRSKQCPLENGLTNDDLPAKVDQEKETTVGFASRLHFFKTRSSSALLEEKRPMIDDPSATSTRVETSQRVFAEGDHPLYVVVDGACAASECLSPSPRMLERKIVCEPGKGASYFERLQHSNNGLSPTKEDLPPENMFSTKLQHLPSKATPGEQEREASSTEEGSIAVEKYQSVKDRFSQKTLPWRQQNAAGKYLDRKRHTICADSPIQSNRPCPVKPVRNSELFCPISNTPVAGSAHAATSTTNDNPTSFPSPFGTPINGYNYGNKATPQ